MRFWGVILITVVAALPTMAQDVSLRAIDSEISPKSSQIEINLKKAQPNSELVKLITLDDISNSQNQKMLNINGDNYSGYLLSAMDKFSQTNVLASYNDFTKAVTSVDKNDFDAMTLSYKLANLGFFSLSQLAINQIEDINLYKYQISSIRETFFPKVILTTDEEILLAELYADIYYNNLARESVKELSKQSNLLRKSDWANYIMAQAYYQNKEYSKALSAVNKALLIKKSSPLYLEYKAKILCEMKDYSDSLKILDKILLSTYLPIKFREGIEVQREYVLCGFYKNPSLSKLHLAKYFYLQGDYQRAQKELSISVSYKKKSVDTLALSGDIYFKLGDYDKAYEFYQKSYAISSKNAPTLIGLGNLSFMKSDYQKALSYYKSALKYSQNPIDTEIAVTLTKFKLNSDPKYQSELLKHIAQNPTYYLGYYTMSMLSKDNSVEYLRQTVALNPYYTPAWLDLAEVSFNSGDLTSAQKYLISAKNIDSVNYRCYYLQGLLYRSQGDLDSALVNFKKCLKLNPNYTPALDAVGGINL